MTDGEHTTRDIAERISYSVYWISSRYDEWSNMGVIGRDGSNSPYEHVISLEEAGIEVPEIPKPDDDSDDSDGSSDGNETEEMTDLCIRELRNNNGLKIKASLVLRQ